ncbi:unnamed protein product [Discula destructiva]
MAPGYRNTQTRRGARAGYPEHDDFEGLPTRQWRKQWVNVAPPPEIEETKKKDRWAEELPHGMPKDSEHLPPHSYALLRAARSGRMHKRPAAVEDDDGDAEGLPGDKTEKKAAPMDEGFKVSIWKQVPRNEEGPTISHLAKRHKNTVTLPSKALGTQVAGPTITKATVRRLDAAGNPYTQEVTVTEGQAVDGDIISTSVIAAPEQSSQTPQSVGTPARRKPPVPQKKKLRGRARARGRGRMVPLTPSARPGPQDGAGLGGASQVKLEGVGPDEVKIENEEGKAGQDIDMPDSSAVDDDDGDEGEGEGEGDDGDDDEGDESGTPAENEDQEMDDAPALPTSSSVADAPLVPTAGDVSEAVPNLAPPTPHPLHTDPSRIEGSPLKNVLLRSPIEAPPQTSLMATSPDTGLSENPDGLHTGLQPASINDQSQQTPVPDVMEETSVEDAMITETAVPEELVSEEAALGQTAPEEGVPEEVALEQSAPEEDASVQPAPEGVVPQKVAPEKAAPEEATPEQVASEQVASEEAAPEQVAPKQVAPEEGASEEAVSEEAAPEQVAPEEVASEGIAPEQAAFQVAAPEEAAPEEVAPEEVAPEEVAPEEVAPEEVAPEEVAPEEVAPEEVAPIEAIPAGADPDFAGESTGTALAGTSNVAATTSTQQPRETSAPPAEEPPSEDISQAAPAVADMPIPTSEDPKTGEAPGADVVALESRTALPDLRPAQESAAPMAAPISAPVEPAPAPGTQAMTEDGTDDGSDILGALGARLDAQAEEDVPQPTSAPAVIPPAEVAGLQNQEGGPSAQDTTGKD